MSVKGRVSSAYTGLLILTVFLIKILFPKLLADPHQATETFWSAVSSSEAGVVTALTCVGLLEASNVSTRPQTWLSEGGFGWSTLGPAPTSYLHPGCQYRYGWAGLT